MRFPSTVTWVVALGVVAGGCRVSPAEADAFVSTRAGFGEASVGQKILLYLPNRLMDLLDVVHVGYGIGPGLGPEFHFTRYGRLGAMVGADAGIAWLGKWSSPLEAAIYARAAAGESETAVGKGQRWRPPKWDVGLSFHALLDVAYAAIAPDELVDFLAGWTTYDMKGDDWPIGPPPEEEEGEAPMSGSQAR